MPSAILADDEDLPRAELMAKTGCTVASREVSFEVGRDIDIANAVAFLASDRAAFMTGSEVVVDGGMTVI